MSRFSNRSESGQALIQVAVMLLVLLSFVALAVDVGSLYGERRQMQNAADAGALAGARQLCLGNGAAAAEAEATNYLIQNQVLAGDIGTNDVTVVDNVVNVIARTTAQTYFAQLFGIATVPVAAEAAGACGGAIRACGIWPISFDTLLWDSALCDMELLVWDGTNENQALTCDANGDGVATEDICDCYVCRFDGNEAEPNDFDVVTDLSRGWLDFSGFIETPFDDGCGSNGCSASELECRLASNSAVQLSFPASGTLCIPGIRGVRASTQDTIDARAGDVVQIPTFTGACASPTQCEGTEVAAYEIDRFVCAQVVGWEQTYTLEPRSVFSDTLSRTPPTKVVRMRKLCDNSCTTACGATDGSTPVPGGLTAVSLIK